jgi:hypothetical protein
MHNYFQLETEANHRQIEHERRVKAAAKEALIARTNTWQPRSLRQVFARAGSVSLAWLANLVAPSPRLSLGVDRVKS